MKMKAEHLEVLRAGVSHYDTPARRVGYLGGHFPNSHKVHDLDVRYRWDLYALVIRYQTPANFQRDLYEYLDDSHIDTALRSIVPKLETAAA